MKGEKKENVYQNVTGVIVQQLEEGKPPEPSQKRALIIQICLILLSLCLIASLVTVTVKYHQELKEKRQVAEAIERLRDSLKHNNVSYPPALEQNGIPLPDKLQLLMSTLEEVSTSSAVTYDFLLLNGWRYKGRNLYYISQEEKSWDEAEEFCESQYSHLTSILTQGEQEYLGNATIGKDHWIGLFKHRTGDWHWVDGADYTEKGLWGKGQPDNWNQDIGGTEDCASLRAFSNGLWNDANCTWKSRWICKFAGQL